MPRLIGEDVHLEVHLGGSLGAVKVDPGQIDQVLLNLVVNARDAMPQGGKILIESANVELDVAYAISHPYVAAGSYVSIAVSDTGTGIDPLTRAHIFEPFFTTKAQGKGTGLGLSTVYGIVKQSGGSVEVYSEPGSGTTFMIYFPRVSSEVTTLAKVEKKPEQATETILLVEDDSQLRELARTILSTQGYRVLMPEHPEDAAELCADHVGHIDLLLTDVVMPNVNGLEIAVRVKSVRPGIKVLYMSGYTSNAIVEKGVLAQGLAYLQKPFSPFTLAEKIREVLNEQ
jgi:two-component system, cell cycle sensor histidine kinase and response regulator CckA